ncbi:MAG: hypothetical protein ACI9C1_000214 [Candidatus Aldehydirespiratoraceae bacterium]|jgi:hypothetical protein
MTERSFITLGTAADTTITVHRERSSDGAVQGLAFEAEHPLTIGDQEATRIVLWCDTAPETVQIVTGPAGPLYIWNVWRTASLIQAWEGDARIEVEDEGEDLGLRCYDGLGHATPTLEARIGFDRSWTQPDE